MDPKRWDFEVFYRVISLSQDMSQDMGGSPNCCSESGMSLVIELSVEKLFRSRQLQTFGNLLSDRCLLHFFDESDYSDWCLLIFLNYSLSLSLSCLDWDFDRWTG